jgi:molybdenum cofactor cytidylyltransferase
MDINGLVISSGFSNRMGKLKPLLYLNGLPFCLLIPLKMAAVCRKITIVVGHEGNKIKEEIEKFLSSPQKLIKHVSPDLPSQVLINLMEKIEVYSNPDFEKGMFTSLKNGIKQLRQTDWLLYHFVDQPGLPLAFYLEFVNLIDESVDWIQPKYLFQKGHPILINARLFPKIIEHFPEGNLREISCSKHIKKKYWDCPYAEVLQDINTPADYQLLLDGLKKD